MRINNINNNMPNFNGYKNFLANSMNSRDGKIIMLSAQLDNNYTPDLDEYQKILSMDKRFQKGLVHKDVLSTFFIASPKNLRFCMNLRPLLFGSELRFMSDCIPQEIYKPEETIHLKTYTILARLTRQIQEKLSFPQDIGMMKVVEQATSFFKEIGHSESAAQDIVKQASSKNIFFQSTAETLNKIIDSSMKILLR